MGKQILSFLTAGDKFLIIFILILSSGSMLILPRIIPRGSYVLVETAEEVNRFSLNDSHTVIIKGKLGNLEMEIKSKKVRIREANCPDKICVRTGWISRTGQTIICVPNQVIIRIVSSQNNPVDAIGY